MSSHQDVAHYVPREPPRAANGAALERWNVVRSASSLRFSLRHIVVQKIRGRFRKWGGMIDLDRASPWLSTVRAWVELGSLETDAPERDAHVRSAEFLDVATFPVAEFESTAIEAREDHLVVRGLLRLHGVTRDVELEVRPRADAPTPQAVYSVRGKIDRQAFGLHWNQDLDTGGVVVGDEVALEAEVAVARSTDEKPRR
jgi:polyisoprenoid-binding protein YceI